MVICPPLGLVFYRFLIYLASVKVKSERVSVLPGISALGKFIILISMARMADGLQRENPPECSIAYSPDQVSAGLPSSQGLSHIT